jgi:DNA-directed RNA polymerase subunit RPC12/RpoP
MKLAMEIRCPYCQSERIKEYLYGYHPLADEAKFILASHKLEDEDPAYCCLNCQRDFGAPKEPGDFIQDTIRKIKGEE